MNILDSIVTQAAAIAAIRRDIHAHPELCFQEVRTADVVAQKLIEWGIPVHRGIGTTGVVGSSRAAPVTGRSGCAPI
jgi:hippurate hydrolase